MTDSERIALLEEEMENMKVLIAMILAGEQDQIEVKEVTFVPDFDLDQKH